LSKILKNPKKLNIPLLVPEVKPLEKEVFKTLIEIPEEEKNKEEKNKKTELEEEKKKIFEEVKKQAEKIGYEEGYKKGFEEGREKGFLEGKKEGFKKGFEEGHRKGYDEGYREASEKGKKEYQELKEKLQLEYEKEVEKIKNFLKNCEAEFKKVVLDLDQEVLKLALDIAKKLVFKEISSDVKTSLRVIREALKYIAEGSRVKIKVNPEEFSAIKNAFEKEKTAFEILEVVPDESISRGGVFIETEMGKIDATFEKRWEKLVEALTK